MQCDACARYSSAAIIVEMRGTKGIRSPFTFEPVAISVKALLIMQTHKPKSMDIPKENRSTQYFNKPVVIAASGMRVQRVEVKL